MPDTRFYCLKRRTFVRNPCPAKKPVRVIRSCRPIRKSKSLTIKPSLWHDIVDEDEEIINYLERQRISNLPTFPTASAYLKQHVMPVLIPAFEKMCAITMKLCIINKDVRFFDFLDLLAEALYNSNPRRSRLEPQEWLSIHQVYTDSNRKSYPFSWCITEDEAATIIQRYYRGYKTRCEYNLVLMKEEHEKILIGIEKQTRCYNTYMEDIVNICSRKCRAKKPEKRSKNDVPEK